MIDRRKFVLGSALVSGAALTLPHAAFAQAATEKRLLLIVQRGAADGLSTLAPMADPDFRRLRGELAETYADVPLLNGMFALHPAYETVRGLYAKKEALLVQAVASSYRQRSHFDGQNLLESGGEQAYALRDGWLNRLLGILPTNGTRALALSSSIPLALQGKQTVSSYAPSSLPDANEDLLQRVGRMYENDPQLKALLESAQQTRMMAGDTDMRNLRDAQEVGTLAASLMSGADGARVMMIESNGWDSHANQAGQFNNQARKLDALIASFASGMQSVWGDTLVMVVTEFGRTVALNGTRGSDHGTASAAMLLGGSVNGGRIVADWPGLRIQDLYQERDLMPTTSLETVLASGVSQHFGLDTELAMRTLFPGRNSKPIDGLISA